MKHTSRFFTLILLADQFAWGMRPYSYDLLPKETLIPILHLVCNRHNPDEYFKGLKNLLVCRKVCKKWRTLGSEIYNDLLNKESAQLTKADALDYYSKEDNMKEAMNRNFVFFVHDHYKFRGSVSSTGINAIVARLKKPPHAIAELLAEIYPDVNTHNPLRTAIELRETEIAKTLIKRGARTKFYDEFELMEYFTTESYDAIKHAMTSGNKNLVKFIEEFERRLDDEVPLKHNRKRIKRQ